MEVPQKMKTRTIIWPNSLSPGHIPCYCCCSVPQLCLTLFNPMGCRTPGFPVLHHFPEFAQTHVHPTISSSVIPFSSCLQSFPASGFFPMSQLFTSGGKSIRVSVSASVLPVDVQGCFPLGLTGLISLLSKEKTIIQKDACIHCTICNSYDIEAT